VAEGIDLYAVFLGPLESLGLDYFVTGSVASGAYGEPRFTQALGRPRNGHFELLHRETGVRADVYVLGNDPLHSWAMEHRRRIELTSALSTWLAPPRAHGMASTRVSGQEH
jgi:hypothetical protein